MLCETEHEMQRAFDAALKDCIENKMSLSVTNTKYMICSRGEIRKPPYLYLIRTAIERVDTCCFLGLSFKYDNNLKSRIDLELDTNYNILT